MDPHDTPIGEPRPDQAVLESLLQHIPLAAKPRDEESLLWRCGFAAGRASLSATEGLHPAAADRVRHWLAFAAATAAAFVVGLGMAGAFRGDRPLRDQPRDLARAARDPVAPPSGPFKIAPSAPPSKLVTQPRSRPDGLYAAMPLRHLDDLLTAPAFPRTSDAAAPASDRTLLRVRGGVDPIDL